MRCAQRPEQRDGRAGDDAEADGVTGTDERRGLFDTQFSCFIAYILHDHDALCDDLGMSETFVIDVWSDVVCPFCYLGTRQLARALEQFEHREDVVLRHRAFELDPHAKLAYDRPLDELVAAKYADTRIPGPHDARSPLESTREALGMTWSLRHGAADEHLRRASRHRPRHDPGTRRRDE